MDLTGKVDLWRRAGIIDAATAERILEFEVSAQEKAAPPASEDRPGAIEAFLYFGLLVLAIGVVSIAASAWDDLESWARAGIVGVPAFVALLLGATMRLFPDPAVRRGGQLAWFVSVGLLVALVLVLGEEYGPGAEDPGPRLAAGVAGLIYAAALWAVWPTHLQVIAIGGAIAFFGQMLGSWPDDFDPRLAGGTEVILSAVALALAETGRVSPLASARLAFSATLVAGAVEMQIDTPWYWEPVGFLAGASLVILSIRQRDFFYMVAGMAALFLALVFWVGEHLADRLGGQLAFTLVGVVIVGGVLLLAQFRRFFAGRRA